MAGTGGGSDAVQALVFARTVTVPKLSVAGTNRQFAETGPLSRTVDGAIASDASETTKIDPLKLPTRIGRESCAEGKTLPGFRSAECQPGEARATS